MKQPSITITLLTPAFVGGVDQSGVWRTPPFKALLREWWRVAAAAPDYDHRSLREREGILFGNAWLDSGATKSQVRLALEHWNAGRMTRWESNDPGVPHPEVKDRTGKVRPVGSQLYLGYGPLIYNKAVKGSSLKANAALQAGETNTLAVAWPDDDSGIARTLQLIEWFGTIGGRSRNGWGSLALESGTLELKPLSADHPRLVRVLRKLGDCLRLDWPHAIGRDENGPFIWHSTDTFGDWRDAMRFLARTKIGFRTNLVFSSSVPQGRAQERHLLAYPVTHHGIAGMSTDARLANQLRFKLFRDGDGLRARVYHTPHASPLRMDGLDQLAVWKKVHAWLDDPGHGLQRLGAAA